MINRDILVKVSNLPDNTNQALSNKSDKTHTHNYAGSSSAGGSATSAEKVNHKLTITNYSLDINESFDGSADISLDLTPDTLGAAWKDHGTHVTFSTTAPKANGTAAVGTASTVSRSDHVHPLQTSVSGSSGSCTGNAATASKVKNTLTIQGNGTSLATFDGSSAKTVNITAANVGAATSSHTHNYAGSSSAGGAANSAAKLSTARTISLTGDVTGSTTFDGSANKSIRVTVVNTPTSGNYFKGFPKIGADGVMEVGKHIDFHLTDTGTTDYNTRITCNNTGSNTLTLPTSSGTIALTSDIDSAIGNINSLLDELNGVSI